MAYNILLVDDDANSRDIVARLLELDGYEVDTAQLGAEALNLLAGRSYDVILSDLRMPQVTGEAQALYRRIERGWSAPRVQDGVHDRRASDEKIPGAVWRREDTLPKPFTGSCFGTSSQA